jgi:RHS repeat-associated protein
MIRKIAIVIALCLAVASGQTIYRAETGPPRFAPAAGGPFDVVNLGNLNVHWTIPVVSKPGRGLPFSYALTYDTAFWTKIQVGANWQWQPMPNWGWASQTQVTTGYFKILSGTATCDLPSGQAGVWSWQIFEAYIDPQGRRHEIGVYLESNPCDGYFHTSETVAAIDGSEMEFFVSMSWGASKVTHTDGTISFAPTVSTPSAGTRTDSNGNRISVSSGVFTDTLGSAALTITGTNPILYKYKDTANTEQTVTVNYTSNTVRTNFSCSGTNQYGPTAASLITSIVLPGGGAGRTYTIEYESTNDPSYPGAVTGRVSAIVLPTGGRLEYSYPSGIDCNDATPLRLDRKVLGDSSTAWIYQRTNEGSGKWLTTVTNPLGHLAEKYQFQKNANHLFFFETQRQYFEGATPKRTIETCYNGATVPCLTTAVSLPTSNIKRVTTLDNSFKSQVYSVFNSAGQPTNQEEYDYGSSAVGPLLRQTVTTYTQPGNGLSLPANITIKNGAGTKQAETKFTYDGTTPTATTGVVQKVAVSGARGNLTKIEDWLTGTTYLSTNLTYFDTGMLRTISDPSAHLTTLGYTDNYSDATNHNTQAFVTSITKPQTGTITHNESRKYYWPSGLPQSATDENNQIVIQSYDSSLRLSITDFPDGGQRAMLYFDTISSAAGITVGMRTKLDATTYGFAYVEFDGYGRKSRTAILNGTASPSNYDQQDFCYDALGRLSFSSLPFKGNGIGNLPAKTCGPASNGTTTTYDALGRVTATSDSVGTIDYTYVGRSEKVQDPGNGTTRITRISQSDALGRLVNFCEVSPSIPGLATAGDCGLDQAGTGFTTAYGYDTLGRLTSVNQPGVSLRTYVYDNLGRLTSVTVPESGTTQFSYNNDGLVSTRIRVKANQTNSCPFSPYDAAKCATTTYAYDALHRLTSTTYTDGTPTASFGYDETSYDGLTITSGKGRLTHSTAGTYSATIHSYDTMGRIITERQRTPYHTAPNGATITYTYDLAGNLKTAYNGALNKTLTYNYDVAARLSSVTSSWSDSNHPGTLLSGLSYNAFGQPLQYTTGDGIQTTLTFDTLGRLGSKNSSAYALNSAGSPVTYAPNSSILSVSDNSVSKSFAYDAMSRMTSSVRAGATTNYTYDRNGNRYSAGGQNLSYGTDNRITGYCYDAAGNLLRENTCPVDMNTVTYKYDAENRMTQVDSGATATYTYDAFSRRVKKQTSAGGVEFLYDQAGRAFAEFASSTAALIRAEIYAGGMHLGTYVTTPAAKTYFVHPDWLGTERVRTDPTGTAVQTCEWKPYGETNAATCTGTYTAYNAISNQNYAGYERDAETGLDHMWFRYYNPRLGRFMTADWIGGFIDEPQSLNKFSYVNGNPANYIDPFGLSLGTAIYLMLQGFNDWYNDHFVTVFGGEALDLHADDVFNSMNDPADWLEGNRLGLPTRPPEVAVPPVKPEYFCSTDSYGAPRPQGRTHNAVDWRNPLGEPVFATFNGIVADINSNNAGGNQIFINNLNGSRTGYAHSMATVPIGTPVRAGIQVGSSDGSGHGSPHLHHTHRPNRDSRQTVDPATLYPGAKKCGS